MLKELWAVWRRQAAGWRLVVVYQMANRFLMRLTEQYATIYIRMMGASAVELGSLTSAAGLAGTLVSPPMGVLQDRYSLRTIFLVGNSLLVAVPLLYATAPSWQWLAPAIIFVGIGRRLGSCAVICDVSLPNRDRATGKALCEGIGAVPAVLAPTLAALLLTRLGGISIEGIRTLFWIQFAAGAALLLWLASRVGEVERTAIPRKLTWDLGFGEVLRGRPVIVRYLVFVTLTWFTLTMMMTFIYPYLHEMKGATALLLGAVTTAMTIAEATCAAPWGRVADRVGRKRAFFLMVPLFTAANVLFVVTRAPVFLVLGGFLFGFRLIADVVQSSMTPELVPAEQLGRWRGLVGSCMGLAAIPAPIIGGILWEQFGPSAVFIGASLVDLIVAVPLLLTIPETLHGLGEPPGG